MNNTKKKRDIAQWNFARILEIGDLHSDTMQRSEGSSTTADPWLKKRANYSTSMILIIYRQL